MTPFRLTVSVLPVKLRPFEVETSTGLNAQVKCWERDDEDWIVSRLTARHPYREVSSRSRCVSWSSIHLFLSKNSSHLRTVGDRVVLELILPLVHDWMESGVVERYFFIRFNEHGSHVRLRLETSRDRFEKCIEPALQKAAGLAKAPMRDEIGEHYPSEHELLAHVRFIPYTPELSRYGGAEAITVSEAFFNASSDIALFLLGEGVESSSARSAKALLASIVLLHALTDHREQAVELAKIYQGFALDVHYQVSPGESRRSTPSSQILEAFKKSSEIQDSQLKETVQSIWRSLDQNEELPSPFEAYHQRLETVGHALAMLHGNGQLFAENPLLHNWQDALRCLVPTYLHMTQNRLGLFAVEESHVGYLAASYLADMPDP